MIETHGLKYSYKDGPSFTFPDIKVTSGEALLILGQSGCGKSTLLHLLAGLLKPKGGQILIDGQDIALMSSAKLDAYRGMHVGLVYQKSYFIESLNVLDNLVLSPFAPDKEKAKTIASSLGIGQLLNKMPNQISVGEQQRATITRAIMHRPSVLLADEPTSALDGPNCEKVIRLLKDQAESQGAALIIVTHDERLRSHISNTIDLPTAMAKNPKI